jgi:DNA invertase Pin-like site-specific DNA recombinase
MRINAAAIYARDATQDVGTIARLKEQIEACRALAQERGYVVVKELAEVGTGADLKRPRLRELRAMVQNQQLDALICYDPSILSEPGEHLHFLEEELAKNGTTVLYVKRET